ncbi:hypothetical protein ASC78_26640 [Variovorax sp. Root318D1]|nr:hypothetical protein ASC78_26640 [Variovorax sp. Root318D1]
MCPSFFKELDVLSKPNHIGSELSSVIAKLTHGDRQALHSIALACFGSTPCIGDLAVNVNYGGRAGTFVKFINILCDDDYIVGGLQGCDCLMGSVWDCVPSLESSLVVERKHCLRIALPALRA